jgi:hypothetical protein
MANFLPYERMPTAAAIDRFLEHWRSTAPDREVLELRSLWVRSGKDWVHVFAHGWAADDATPRETLIAPAFRGEAWSVLGHDRIAETLRAAFDGGLLPPCDGVPAIKVTHEASLSRSEGEDTDEWPCLYLELDAAVGAALPLDFHKALVTADKRVFGSGDAIIRSWMRRPEWKNNGSGGNRGLIVVLEERRGRIASVTASDVVSGLLNAWVEPAGSRVDRVVGEVTLGSGSVVHYDLVRGERDVWHLQLPEDAHAVKLIALIEDDVVHVVGPLRPDDVWSGRSNWVSVGELRAWIAAGESDRVEFKAWKALKGDRDLVAKAVVAFANRGGGTVLIGVGNQGQLDGADARHQIPDGALTAVADLSEALRSTVDPPVDVALQPAILDGRVVVVVRVPAGHRKPHVLTTKGTAFVRVAATSRPATRDELLQMLRESERQ